MTLDGLVILCLRGSVMMVTTDSLLPDMAVDKVELLTSSYFRS